MRVWLLSLLLALPFSYALVVGSTGQTGTNPVIYGELIAYEYTGNIHVYDVLRKEDYSFGPGSSPYIFGFTVVFETRETDEDLNDDGDTEDTVIRFANVRDKKITSTNAVGHHPSIYSDLIIFSTKESEMAVDLNNDGDEDDDIIRHYSIDSKEVTLTKVVGDFPVANQNYFVFQSSEKQIGFDLNADGDAIDDIISVYTRDTKEVKRVSVAGQRPILYKSNYAVFTSDGEIKLIDARTAKVTDINQSGSSPFISGDAIMFTRDGKLYGWNMQTKTVAKLDVVADQVSIFADRIAFTTSEKLVGDLNDDGKQDSVVVRYAREEDIDGDGVSDFTDNCFSISNNNQSDVDNDGIGDECEIDRLKKADKKPESNSEQPGQEKVAETETPGERKGIAWYWYVLIILLLPFIAYYGYKYYRKRQKSFGF